MIVVPTTPISFSGSLLREWEVVQHSANVLMSLVDDISEVRLFIILDFLLSRTIDLLRQ
jgi:hypothetical protein